MKPYPETLSGTPQQPNNKHDRSINETSKHVKSIFMAIDIRKHDDKKNGNETYDHLCIQQLLVIMFLEDKAKAKAGKKDLGEEAIL